MRIRHGHDGRRANQQEDKDMGKWIAAMRQSALWERVVGKSTGGGWVSRLFAAKGFRKAVRYNEAIESNEQASYCIPSSGETVSTPGITAKIARQVCTA
jgi:hypothetical protein